MRALKILFKYRKRWWLPILIVTTFATAWVLLPVVVGIMFQGLYLVGFMAIQVIAWIGIFFYVLAGRVKIITIMPQDLDLTWDDYQGQPEVVRRAKAWLRYLRGVEDFEEMGGQFTGGLLMEGPPGAGKTYLAKVLASEAGIPFISVEANSLLGTFMGIGPLKVGRMFSDARNKADEHGAAILFIDEIDSIGGARGGVMGGQPPIATEGMYPMMGGMGGQILNTLLIELDGMSEKRGRIWRLRRKIARWVGEDVAVPTTPRVMVIGSTNRPDILDPALVRPGRLGKRITIDLPNKEGTEAIARYYLKKVRHADDLVASAMAQDAMDQTPNVIKFALNDAVVIAHDDGRNLVTYSDWRTAISENILGLKQPLPLGTEERWRLAVHEAGHAVISAAVFGNNHVLQRLSVERYGKALGHLLHVEREKWQVGKSRSMLEAAVMVGMAGGVAEEVFLKERQASMGGDLPAAMRILAYMASHGMFGWWPQESKDDTKIREEVHDERVRLWEDARACLEQNRDAHERLVHALIAEPYELDRDEIAKIIEGRITPWKGKER